MELQTVNSTVVTATEASNTELSCEMSAFIRDDSSLVWEGPGGQRISHLSDKYQIIYSNGTPNASVNGTIPLAPSRLSTLVISDLDPSDSGNYTCRILNTNQASTIRLEVTTNGTTTSMSSESDILPSSTNLGMVDTTTAIGTGSALGTTGLLVAVTVGLLVTTAVILVVVVGCLLLTLRKRRGKSLNSNNPAAHVYDYISEDNHYQVVDVVKRDCTSDGIEVLNRNKAYGVCTIIGDSLELEERCSGGKDIRVERNEAYSELDREAYGMSREYAEITS